MVTEGHVVQVSVPPASPGLFRQVLSPGAYKELTAAIVGAKSRLEGRVIWNINSTARGGGVAEMLQSLVAYARGAGIDTRWAVISVQPEFFRITKRIHNQIQGFAGDGGELGQREHDEYERSLLPSANELAFLVRRNDIVILHDPQTAGLAPAMKQTGAKVVWRCHVGIDTPNELSVRASQFLNPYLVDADAYVFSRHAFAWKGLDQAKLAVIPPSIDPFTPKNNFLTQASAAAILIEAGLLSGYAAAMPYYARSSGSIGLVARQAEIFETARLPINARLVVQVSRWDRLKDPVGVLTGFSHNLASETAVHLILAGPEVTAVADDPEGAAVLDEVVQTWRALPERARDRVHLACLPMQDLDENAAIVNALQRRAEVVVQKSLAEGFGLTVSEAMWKGRPVVASSIGGIKDQIEHEKTGLLLDDPTDLKAFGVAVSRLLSKPDDAAEMGKAGQERVRQSFLSDRHLKQYAELFARLDS
jgi:trehalose synthase